MTARIESKYGPVYRDAHMLLRPRTAAKDQTLALDPGTEGAGAVPDGGTLTADFDGDDQAQIALVRGMVAAGIGVLSISEARNNLEEIFMRLVDKSGGAS